MHKGNGLRKYLYEYLFYKAVERARDQTDQVIPISQAKSIRREIDERLRREVSMDLANPQLGMNACMQAIDRTLAERVPGYEAPGGVHKAPMDEFVAMVGMNGGSAKDAILPISPYDPEWSERASVKRGGTALAYVPDAAIVKATGGGVAEFSDSRHGNVVLMGRDEKDQLVEIGRAMTHDDASGLTALMGYMSDKEYREVRGWVIDGGRDHRTGQIDRTRFMSTQAVQRSVAVLDELRTQGIGYEITRDRKVGQIKARIKDSSLEVRLIDPLEEEYAGARIYDNGIVTRFSTNVRTATDRSVIYSPTPEEAVKLLRIAQGQSVPREDRPDLMVGQAGGTHLELRRGGAPAPVQDSYNLGREIMSVVGDYTGPEAADSPVDAKVFVRREGKDRTRSQFFIHPEDAEKFAREAIDSARENMVSALDIDALVERARTELERTEGDLDLVTAPEYSSDAEIASIQRAYWDVLTGRREHLLRPGATEEMYHERLESIGENIDSFEMDLGNLAYTGDAESKVRDHAEDVALEMVGTWESEMREVTPGQFEEQRFHPGRVSKWMTSPVGQWSNLDNLAAAMRRAEVAPSEIMGTDFQSLRFKDRLIRFNPETARDMFLADDEFTRNMAQVIKESIEVNGARVPSDPGAISIDSRGVVLWQADRLKRDGGTVRISGEIGQILSPGAHGEIVTDFASGENALIVPGFDARIAAQVPGEAPKSVEERTLLRGYEQLMAEKIREQMADDLVSGRTYSGEGASLNGVYSHVAGTKHPVDFIERSRVMGPVMSERERQAAWEAGDIKDLERDSAARTDDIDPWTASIIETEARRVRYSNEVKQGSTFFAEHRARTNEVDPANDNTFDAWQLTGGRNMAVLTGKDSNGVDAPGGYFDPVMTGGATNQGIVRYLTADAEVTADGRIVPGDPSTLTGSRAPLMTRPELETLRYDPFDRQQMTASTIMQSSEVTEPTSTALMTFGGWTADDPIVVSREFAEKHRIRGAGGQERALVVGDKLSDLHGNKGVISLVVDRHMDLDVAREQDLENEVAWFKKNSSLDVVMSPFSLISRRNAGSARELMSSEHSELERPFRNEDGSTPEPTFGGLADMRFVVTHMAVDEKTKIYDDEQVRAGRGRKASSQLAWALQSQDCPAIMREFYGHNSGAEANLREYLTVTGLDMEADGTLRVVGGRDAVDESPERRLIEMTELKYSKARTQKNAQGEMVEGRRALNLPQMRREFGELIGDKGGDLALPFPLTFPTGEPLEQLNDETWKLPVLSSHLRSGQEFEDGSTVTHDYTRNYQEVYAQACKYRHFQAILEDPSTGSNERYKAQQDMVESVGVAQRSFEAITGDVQNRVLSGKNNIFKNGIMASRLSDSATMVWTGDPRLDIDQIALNPMKAEQLGLVEGDHALVWRDPVLRDAGVRYMRVAIDERLTGAAINPVMDKCFDGDFDGDSVAVVKLHTESAKAEAMEKLSVPANLVDLGVVDREGKHPLAMQVSLDTQVGISRRHDLKEAIQDLAYEANQIEVDRTNEDAETTLARREDITDQLSDFYRDAQRTEFGAALSFSNCEVHLQSIREVCVETGAKGSEKKLAEYAKNLGDQRGVTGLTREDQEASMYAAGMKAHGTGLGGMYSQRAVRALRGDDLKAVLEVTYPVTQSILQAKHSASEARHKYEMLQGPGRNLWRGRKLEHEGPGVWKPVYEDGEAVQASTEEWIQQFNDFYSAADGFNVSIDPQNVEKVADALTDPTTGLIRNLEEDEQLAGTPLDRMAYGGDFETLVEIAKKRESLYDGEKASQFASAGTRRVLRENERQLSGEAEISELKVADSVIKSDVIAEHEDKARARGAMRRSTNAVSVGRPSTRLQSFEELTGNTSSSDYEMEV